MKTLVRFILNFFGMRDFNISVKSLGRKLNVNRDIRYLFTLLFVLLVSFSNATVYYVSVSGNDANTGTSENQPWQTLAKVSGTNFSPGDQILFKRGDEWSGSITVTSSGSTGSPIVYGAYGSGEKPKIYGSEKITGWIQHSGNIYKATFGKKITQLFLNEDRTRLARYPNSGYFNISSVQSTKQFTSNELNAGINYTGAKWIGRTSAYRFSSSDITASSSQTLTLASTPIFSMDKDEGFFLCNKLEFLDQAGEWYYDANSQTIYVWTPNGHSPTEYEVRGAVFENGFNIENKNYVTIQNIEIKHHKGIGIFSANSSYLTFDNNVILNPDAYGIRINGWSSNNVVSNNIISGANADGIVNYSANSVFRDNHISEISLLDNIGIGKLETSIGIRSRGENVSFTHNRITNSAYIGIYFYGANNLIQYNYINEVCKVLDDGGGLYTYSGDYSEVGSAGSKVIDNIVLNVHGNRVGYKYGFEEGYGIYIDNFIHDVEVANNTVAYCDAGGIFLHEDGNIDVNNNTLLSNGIGLKSIKQKAKSSFTNNIVYGADRPVVISGGLGDVHQMAYQEFGAEANYNYNKYYNPYESNNVFQRNLDFNAWKSNTSQDTDSRFNGTSLGADETEKLFYNDTKQIKTISLGSVIYRDLDGNTVSGSITLEPFKSKILITKNNVDGGENQKPEMDNQTFGILGDKQVDDFIAQVVASDPDEGQILTYEIEGGNEEGLFYIDATSGAIYAASVIYETSDKTIQLVVTVTDNATEPLSASAIITINITGVDDSTPPDGGTPPNIISFAIPSTSSSLTVPITSFTTDGNATGYMLSTSSEDPTDNDSNWTTSVPTSYVFSESGTHTLFAWVKDNSANISTSSSATTTITLDDVDLTPIYSEYRFEEVSGATVIDSRSSNDGMLFNEDLRVEGVRGQGLQLTGTGYVGLGQCFGENVTYGVTISTWIKPTSSSGDYQGLVMHGGPVDDSFALYIKHDSKTVAFKTTSTSASWTAIDNVDIIWDGNWHHVAVTYNGAEKVIYIDNQEFANVSANGKIVSGIGYNLYIGAGRDQASPIALYTGYIDEVRVYNYGLTSSEIEDIYNSIINDRDTVYTSEEINICEGESYNGWTSAGEYQRVLQSSTGGDSIVTTYLLVNPVYDLLENIVIQAGEDYNGWTTSGQYVRNLTTVFGCDSTITTNLYVGQDPRHFIPVWDGENGQNHMTFVITEALVDSVKLGKGDEIAVFDNDLCVGAMVLSASINIDDENTYVFISASQDNGSSNGFTTGNNVTFKIWDSTEKVEKVINNVIYHDDLEEWITTGKYVPGGTSVVEIGYIYEDPIITQTIKLDKGWNIFSASVVPDDPDMKVIQQELRDSDFLFKVQDEIGRTYEKIRNVWINNIGDMEQVAGYRIRVKTACNLDIIGTQVILPMNINVRTGSNLISFPYNGSVDAMQVIQPLIGAGILEKVQDQKGNSIEYWGSTIGWLNGIGNFVAGQGYMVQVNADGVLPINDVYEKSVLVSEYVETVYFKPAFEGNGSNHMNINLYGLSETNLKVGDEIAAYDGDICVGAVTLTSTNFNNNVASISASESDLDEINGFINNNDIALKFWSSEANELMDFDLTLLSGDMLYNNHSSVFVKLNDQLLPDDDEGITIGMYPNPATINVNVRFSQIPDSRARIILMDINGKQLQSRQVQSSLEVFDVRSYPTGIYFVKTIMGDIIKTHKLVKN
ncbi:right-handed parallel beta-helix repeat-containing protein [Prolixibacteraceae bacterium Z1-6]|uniref:Right-handed parallel beta-helix repeat-containing protein n=1 Tax=Draconibacterium aestuarii TaxID=2998507 RepID=A0A9X3F9X7_9BACT|nr:right-handed parallel beta-helix repeat-containing protein [Prolixibacteraceae bacterium Z1-6]